jgi:uracil-DNA glycosylase
MSTNWEALRRAYRPERVKMLFVGESPPMSGRFFYNRDSGLYRAVRDAFHQVDSSINDENFLTVFRGAGCYLVDACLQPVDRMKPAARRNACLDGEPRLTRRIRAMQPETIVTLVRSIQKNVERAIVQASWKGTLLTVPYPGRWVHHREEFMTILIPHLKALLKSSGRNNRRS